MTFILVNQSDVSFKTKFMSDMSLQTENGSGAVFH